MNKQTLSPKIINLLELKFDCKEYFYNNESAEISDTIEDLIGDNPFEVRVKLQSIGDAYSIEGEVKTTLDLACSKCAVDFKYKLNFNFKEIVMIDDGKDYSNGSQSRQNFITHNGDSETYCHTVETTQFDVGEYIHEQIAINEPLAPMGKKACDNSCDNFKNAVRNGWIELEHSVNKPEENTHNPFQSLENIKLNS